MGRTLKLAKYLPDAGVQPSVLTCANPSVPVFDESLMRDVDPDMEIVRARTLEPGYGLKKATWESEGGGPKKRGAMRSLVGMAGGLARAALVPDPQICGTARAAVLGRGGGRVATTLVSSACRRSRSPAGAWPSRGGHRGVLDYLTMGHLRSTRDDGARVGGVARRSSAAGPRRPRDHDATEDFATAAVRRSVPGSRARVHESRRLRPYYIAARRAAAPPTDRFVVHMPGRCSS